MEKIVYTDGENIFRINAIKVIVNINIGDAALVDLNSRFKIGWAMDNK